MHIKICGITTLQDARSAIDAGADYLGFNFHPASPRSISAKACSEMTSVLSREYPQVRRVGVFVNMPLDEVRSILEGCGLDLAQLHGDETPQDLAALGARAFKAFRGVPLDVKGYARLEASVLLLDAAAKNEYGGTGRTADWPAAAELAKKFPMFLAGGLNPENVAAAVKQVKPWGVDVASGVESSPGRKEAQKLEAFVRAARQDTL